MISEDDVRHVARLARLYLEPGEAARMTGELAKILDHIDKIGELDLATVPPTAHVLAVTDVVRADKPRPGLEREEALRNAPAVSDDCFRVPRMQS
jgi:aspartyl-tRNA(Asn)/glutamyl-tRNA(Gln) amidotransferase subunit C